MAPRCRTVVAGLGVGMALLALAGPATPTAGPPAEVSSSERLPIAGLETAGTRSGRQLVVWLQTDGGLDDPRQLWGRTIGKGGRPLGSEFPISRAAVDGMPVSAETPAVTARGQRNEFLVVWSQRVEGSGGTYLAARRIDAKGTPLADEFAVTSPQQFASASGPSVAYGARRDEFMLVWDARRPRAGSGPSKIGHEVYAARLRGGRSNTPRSVRISSMGGSPNDASGGRSPAVAYNSDSSGYLVVWDGEDAERRALFARTLSARPAGNRGRVREVSRGADADLAFNPRTREYVVTGTVSLFRPDARVYARRIRPNGRARGRAIQVAPDGRFGDAGNADVDAGPGRGYQVVYDFSDSEFGDREVFARRLGRKLKRGRARRVAGGGENVSAGAAALAVVSRDRDFRVVWFETSEGANPRVLLRGL